MRAIRHIAFSIIAAQTVALAQTVIANAQGCSVNRKQIEFSGKLCRPRGCGIINHKVRFLGQTILLYPEPSKDEGTIFQLGQPMEMKDANNAWRSSGPPGASEIAIASADQRGGDFFLSIHQQWSQSGKVVGDAWRKIGIRVLNCALCDVFLYEINFDARVGQETRAFKSTFDKYTCRVYD